MKITSLLTFVFFVSCMSPDALRHEEPNDGQARIGSGGMVVSASSIASSVGRDVLDSGGNAVDAAIAVGLCLAVTYPQAGNIGGGGFMVVRHADGRTTTLDFREKAPAGSHPDMFIDRDGKYSSERHHDSHLAVGVPGTIAGFAKAHAQWGKKTWRDLVAPATGLAREGFVVSERFANSVRNALSGPLESYPESRRVFTIDGRPPEEGAVFRQPDLAATLARIETEGHDGFYRGETARLLIEEMGRNGGIMSYDDLANYAAVERNAIVGSYRGFDIIGMPPPSSGGTAIVQMLNILEGYDLKSMGRGPKYHHLLAEVMRRAFRDRARWQGDTDFVDVPIAHMTSKNYAASIRKEIRLERASVSALGDISVPESPETTHYSVVDQQGLAVSVTYTLEQSYGSGIVVPGAGFLLNNEMGDFNAKAGWTSERGHIGTKANMASPQKRMLSSMSPVIVARDGQLVAVVGSPGGRTIINTVLQVILNLIDHEMSLDDAVAALRIHHQWLPDEIRCEDDENSTLVAGLRAMGHRVKTQREQGRAHCIAMTPAGRVIGVADPRDDDAGAAATK